MIHAQNEKHAVLITPQSVATNATATGRVDTLGFDYAAFDYILDSAAATSSNPATLDLQESDDTVATNFASIGTFTGDDTTDGFTIPNADTANAQIVRMNVDLRGRKRYLRARITPEGAAQIVGVVGHLSRAREMPSNTTDAGVAALVNG